MVHFLNVHNFTLIALASAVFGAIAMILARVILKALPAKAMLSSNFLVMTLILLCLSPFFYKFHLTILSLTLVFAVGLIDTAGNYFYFKTFEKTEAGIAAPVLSLAPFFTFALSWLLLSDYVPAKTLFMASGIIISIIIFSTDFRNFKAYRSATLIPALCSSVLFGLTAIPSKYLLDNLHAINAPTLYLFRAAIIALSAMLLFGLRITHISTRQYGAIVLRALVVIAQWILLYTALAQGSAGVSVTLANVTPVFVFIVSILFLHEKPTLKKVIAASLVIVLSLLI